MAGPISISAPGHDVLTANGPDLTLNSQYPFAKLDSTSDNSFQTINISFAHEPPNPNGASVFYQRTLVYSFAHGYTYVPSTWFLVSLDGFLTSRGSEGNYLVGGGDFPANSSAVFIAEVGSTNVNFYIDKYYTAGLGIVTPDILGYTLSIRSYIFVNDLLGTDIPSQA